MNGTETLLAVAVALAATAFAAFRLARFKSKARLRRERAREEALLDRVAAGLAHEIKNPLGALSLNVQLLEEELAAAGQLPAPSRARLAVIARDYHRLEDVVNSFLRYAARKQMSLAEVDLNSIVSELATFLRGEIAKAGATMDLKLQREPVICRADAPLVKQALLNVILNAIEAMAGGKGKLAISTELAEGVARVHVTDAGAGISETDLPRIFDAYFSTKKDGTGLGLAITKRIIEDHDGRIDVQSTPGSGTEVIVSLPVAGPKRSLKS